MSDEELMKTSDIMARLRHTSLATTRSWIRNQKLTALGRDLDTGEKTYSRAEFERLLAAMPRGPYGRRRPSSEGRASDDHGVPDSD